MENEVQNHRTLANNPIMSKNLHRFTKIIKFESDNGFPSNIKKLLQMMFAIMLTCAALSQKNDQLVGYPLY